MGEAVSTLMASLANGDGFSIPAQAHERMTSMFSSARADEDEVGAKMAQHFAQTGQLADPHTAVGLVAADKSRAAGLNRSACDPFHGPCGEVS